MANAKQKVFSKDKWLETANADKAAGILTQREIDDACEIWVNDLDGKSKEEIADNNGKKKSDFPQLSGVTVPAKGYYRSLNPYYYNGEYTKTWVKPAFKDNEEVAVFNNRIAMNWDEVEDLGMLFSGKYNPKPGEENKANPVTEFGTQYGYFTEWWFNYGWSVGGDCLNDLTDGGEWNFSLLDPNPNFVVADGKDLYGQNGQDLYAGETISFVDKMNILQKDGKDEVLVPDVYGDYLHDNANVVKKRRRRGFGRQSGAVERRDRSGIGRYAQSASVHARRVQPLS